MLIALMTLLAMDQPAWMRSSLPDRAAAVRGPAYGSIGRIPEFAKDMYATGVGHAMAYEALVTGATDLETKVFASIDTVLRKPPALPVDEESLSPRFSMRFRNLEKVFEWAHQLHFETIDILAYPGTTDQVKHRQLSEAWDRYSRAPWALTGLPMNMEVLDSQPYSGRFREKYPKVNGLFWGYHWLQTVNYDMMWRVPTADHRPQYELIGAQYRETELYKTDREVMPMTAEMSPRFAKAFPMIANAFDNLHMLHDNVNDILATPGLSAADQQQWVNDAIVRVLASSHAGEVAGAEGAGIHDHRHPPSQPGMGTMKGSDEDEMYMSGMGWMDMGECAHCSMSMPSGEPWGATVSANGWTMSVRCLLCARDMAAETPGRAIIRAATEDPNRLLVLISDEEGNWKSNIATVAFLESGSDHAGCHEWSRAYTSPEALKRAVAADSSLSGAVPLGLTEWAARVGGKPSTYRKITEPSPYQKRGGVR